MSFPKFKRHHNGFAMNLSEKTYFTITRHADKVNRVYQCLRRVPDGSTIVVYYQDENGKKYSGYWPVDKPVWLMEIDFS